MKYYQNNALYFIKYFIANIVHTWISQWFWAQKKLFLLFKNSFKRINHCKFIHHKIHLKTFLSYVPCIVRREYFSFIFNVKKCALYLIKYGTNFWTGAKVKWNCCSHLSQVRLTNLTYLIFLNWQKVVWKPTGFKTSQDKKFCIVNIY
jgi:hypothetical protein